MQQGCGQLACTSVCWFEATQVPRDGIWLSKLRISTYWCCIHGMHTGLHSNGIDSLGAVKASLLPRLRCSSHPGAPGHADAASQLHLLGLLPVLMLRMKRNWLAFLSDYLQMLLHWCALWVHLAFGWQPRLLS